MSSEEEMALVEIKLFILYGCVTGAQPNLVDRKDQGRYI